MTSKEEKEQQEIILYNKAKEILKKNWNGRFTIPSPTLYPHQWSWDAGFIAIGNSYSDIEKSIKEIEFLYDAQWKNGMIPHIVFNEKERTYFPAADFYDIKRSENAPATIGTSGMTQPPVHAISCYYIFINSTDKTRSIEFLKRIYPKLKLFHRFLMTDRDPERSGLVTIFHPWESGLDDSPIWDEPMSRINVKDLPAFKRLDIIAVGGPDAADTIPSNWEYDRFIYLIELMKKYDYDQKKLYELFPFKVKDIVFSSILYVANKFLIEIAKIIGEDLKEINEWLSRTEQNFHKYFFNSSDSRNNTAAKLGSNEESLFYDYDLIQKKSIKKKTISSLIPIYTGLLSKEEAEVIVRWITHAHFCGEGSYCHVPTIPSTDLEVSYFKPITYWRGPVWINTNWMIWLGLQKYGYFSEANLIKEGVFELVKNHGFREYYDPYKGQGLGGRDFSWTASLVIDMLMNKGIGIPP
ncbi:MAG TPA: trehalase family glycosidase [Candidatus Nitrosocosmicus sp.]|nr:trehalase family glycosidase [Candidatus Nitrosocosmicus sp.]